LKLIYRPEIDGLRAIAVSAVILYHSKISIFGYSLSGGFIGVDIFFVISGYLITSIILNEVVTYGSFSFKYFYERRIRRILPILLLVISLSLAFAWLYLLPNDFVNFSKSILYSLGFSSNFYFHFAGQEYDAESGLFIPLLHTWSLSVEEQFYILFPIFLIITFKFFRKYLIQVIVFSFILSFGLADLSSRNNPSVSFYFIHTRMWELLAGSILAYFEVTLGHRSKNQNLNLILPTVGIFLIIYSILFFSHKIIHPSFNTLFPIIGVCLIIWFSNKDEFVTKILSTKIFVGIGLISYSLYLWHYPVFAFARITYFFQDNFIKELSSGLLILFLSVSSFYLIEKPFRNKKYQFRKLLLIILFSTIILTLFSFIIIKENGFQKRVPEIFQVKLIENNIDLYQNDNTQKVVIIGDSHAKALTFQLNEKIKEKDLSLFRFDTRMYLKNFKQVNSRDNEEYLKNNSNIDNFLKKNSNLIVIFHQRWSVQLERIFFDNNNGNKKFQKLTLEENIRRELASQIKNIVELGHKLILVYPVPEMNFIPKRLLYRKHLFENNSFENSYPILSSSYDSYQKRNKLIFEILDSVETPDIYRVYPHKVFCDKQIKNRCIANDEENIFYSDDDHLSIQGSNYIVDEIMKKIEKIKF
tara:strand:- start:419 stop:2344 length:1926 start_codon:yes stop_codon:yes gene_type:complete